VLVEQLTRLLPDLFHLKVDESLELVHPEYRLLLILNLRSVL
jgi:hypothetical protein